MATTAANAASTAATAAKERAGQYVHDRVDARIDGIKKKSNRRGIREMWNQYGSVFVGTYASVYLATLSAIFVGIDTGWFDPISWGLLGQDAVDKTTSIVVSELLDKYEWTRPYAEIIKDHPHYANFGLAWLSTKPTEPIRIAVAMYATPRVADYLGYVEKEDGADKEEKEVAEEGDNTRDAAASSDDGINKEERRERSQEKEQEPK